MHLIDEKMDYIVTDEMHSQLKENILNHIHYYMTYLADSKSKYILPSEIKCSILYFFD